MGRKQTDTGATGRFSYDGLDRVLHEKARLGILTSLLTHPDGLTCNDLKSLCALTDGNLSRHLAVLQEEGMVEVEKGLDGKKPKTQCHLSLKGRERFIAYLSVLEKVVKDATTTKERKLGGRSAELGVEGGTARS